MNSLEIEQAVPPGDVDRDGGPDDDRFVFAIYAKPRTDDSIPVLTLDSPWWPTRENIRLAQELIANTERALKETWPADAIDVEVHCAYWRTCVALNVPHLPDVGEALRLFTKTINSN